MTAGTFWKHMRAIERHVAPIVKAPTQKGIIMATVRDVEDKVRESTNSGDAAEVSAQLAQLREDLSNLASSVKALGAGVSAEVKAKASRVADDAYVASEEAVHTVRNEIQSINDNLTEQVQRNPLQSLGIAAAAGFLLAIFTRR